MFNELTLRESQAEAPFVSVEEVPEEIRADGRAYDFLYLGRGLN